MKLYIDDIRPTPNGYKRAYSVKEAQIYCCQHLSPNKELKIEEISIDHDAGDYRYLGGDYIEFLNWLEYKAHMYGWIVNTTFRIHSGNIVGRQNMERIIKHNGWTLI